MNTIPIQDLAAPFAPNQVKQHRGNFGQQLSYVDTGTVIARLNETLGSAWSFTVVETMIEPDEVIVRGRLIIGEQPDAAGNKYQSVTAREQFGGSRITRHKDTGAMINLADNLKSAASDALKKCASLAGVGLYLYGEQQPDVARGSASKHHGSSAPTNGNNGGSNGGNHSSEPVRRIDVHSRTDSSEAGRVANAQIARIFEVALEQGVPQKDVISLARETFGVSVGQLTPPQAENLMVLLSNAA